MYRLTKNEATIIKIDGEIAIPKGHKLWREYQVWLLEDNTPSDPDPDLEPITDEEAYSKAIQNQKLLKALLLSLNDGSFVPGQSLTTSELKTIIKNKM